MSKIYDALVHAANNRHSRTAAARARSGHQSAGLLNLSSRNISVEWKITGAVASVILVFGFLLLILANQLMTQALRKETDKRALAMTHNLSNAAVSSVVGNNILQLYASVTQYAQLQGVAYAFIEDRDGKIIANSMRPFPSELVGTSPRDDRKQVDTRSVTLQGKTVYETRVPILEGQLGAAHLGIWAEEVTKKNLRQNPQTCPAGKFLHPHDATFDQQGNIYIVEDRGGGIDDDIWFAKDLNGDGDLLDVGEGIGRWASNGTVGSELTGLYFDPFNDDRAWVNIQHPASDNDRTIEITLEGDNRNRQHEGHGWRW